MFAPWRASDLTSIDMGCMIIVELECLTSHQLNELDLGGGKAVSLTKQVNIQTRWRRATNLGDDGNRQ